MSWLSKLAGGGKSSASSGSSGTANRDRPATPPKIVIDHHEYVPEEFALGSFRIRPYDGDLIGKQQFDFRMVFDLGNDPVDVACHGLVVKMTDQTGLVARYQSPQPFYERKLIDYVRAWKGL
ncbi:hypothetical protein [Azospirillum doebereinerae]|uniref:Uncharacterized protein n=1 Tax=Azospirillum doebereinerae TaxID=92933 RepID=A0A433JEF4_9PROT|nr:hypothetical protein [Azospirillum doebereinerae]MCG5242224.1 hypothetical protein [Azospirillum doebereinerae]RUQ75554.1 hypothetical protein EJ913_00060 [Azospirillum doebereinerae]